MRTKPSNKDNQSTPPELTQLIALHCFPLESEEELDLQQDLVRKLVDYHTPIDKREGKSSL